MDRDVQVMFLVQLSKIMEKHLPPRDEVKAVMELSQWYKDELEDVVRFETELQGEVEARES